EVRGQGAFRRQGASAALSRTDWEIAFQEAALAVRVVRTFAGVLYREEKLQLTEQTLRVNEEAAQQVRRLVEQAKLRPADLILARTEVEEARAQLGAGRTALGVARHELRRALGVTDGTFELQGTLERPPQEWDALALLEQALERRADLRARQEAVAEADARLRLAQAGRFGNPTVGPDYEYDAARVSNIGVQLAV